MNKRERAICWEIYEQNKKRIYYFLLKQCKWLDEDDIHDVMQEVWKALSENIHEMCEWSESSCWAWLATVPEFCKELSKKCSGHRVNRGVQGIFEMHKSVVFFLLF